MYTKWTSHLKNPEEKQRFESAVLSSKLVLKRLYDIIADEENGIEQSELDAKAYDNPAWAYKQAYKNGAKAAYRVIKKTINLDEQVIKE
jgi:hypothetical protein